MVRVKILTPTKSNRRAGVIAQPVNGPAFPPKSTQTLSTAPYAALHKPRVRHASVMTTDLLALQQTAGNRTVLRFMRKRTGDANDMHFPVQTKGTSIPVMQIERTVTRSQVLQRWGPSEHRKLTLEGVRGELPKVKVDEQALKQLANGSTDMDLRLPELWFNFKGKLTGVGKNMRFYNAQAALRMLSKLYNNNVERAKNHGEGGLYDEASTTQKSALINETHQMGYELKAWESYRNLNQAFSSIGECERTKLAVRDNVLSILGDALHVAQDRGAHGEGAAGQGHAKQILEGVNPDDPGKNGEGYQAAKDNTAELIASTSMMLLKLLDERYTRTCSFVRPAESTTVHHERAEKKK